MMRRACFLFCVILALLVPRIIAAQQVESVSMPRCFSIHLSGRVGPFGTITLNLLRDGDEVLGDIYTEQGAPAELSGASSVEDDGTFHLEVADAGFDGSRARGKVAGGKVARGKVAGGKVVDGTLNGRLVAQASSVEAVGSWTSADGKQHERFQLEETSGKGISTFETERTVRSLTSGGVNASIEFVRPLLAPVTAPAAARVNADLLSRLLPDSVPDVNGLMEAFFRRFRSAVAETGNRAGDMPWWDDGYQTYVAYNEHGIIGLESEMYWYEGGAHPNAAYVLSNYDAATGRRITLADILKRGYESKLDAIAETKFRAEYSIPPGQTLEDAGYWFEGGVFKITQNFLISGGGLFFQFNPYEIGPYAIGAPSVFIPYERIRDLLQHPSVIDALEH